MTSFWRANAERSEPPNQGQKNVFAGRFISCYVRLSYAAKTATPLQRRREEEWGNVTRNVCLIYTQLNDQLYAIKGV